ncbi:MAG TPA: hypothetical protein VN222_00575 [Novosphingobium sp.]|nr:hypothetical protein [Novosphingobium sp.]
METQTTTQAATEMPHREPARARALLSTADFHLLRAALASHAKATDDPMELARINALFHRLGNYR